jgi:hypothetical protein
MKGLRGCMEFLFELYNEKGKNIAPLILVFPNAEHLD